MVATARSTSADRAPPTAGGALGAGVEPGETMADPNRTPNGCFLPVLDADGVEHRLGANLVQFDEHTDENRRELSCTADDNL